ncbi:MAG: VaFE repeat-containing surface-anchored protein, partial [Erysipelotrichaceae bacterium]|nr:VaFE repeat-containing surface-anchored protein [Erysipelotrichaceae bacterium]
MKTLKKTAVIFMMLLLFTTSFTYSVRAEDDQTADDASSSNVEVVQENGESLPEEAKEENVSEVIETDEIQEEISEETVAENATQESDGAGDIYFTVSYMFADATARDGIGSLPDEIMDLLPEKEEVKDIDSYEPVYPKQTEVSGYVFNGYEPYMYDNGDILYQGIWYKDSLVLFKAPLLRAEGSQSFGYGGQQNWGLTGGWGYSGHNGFSIGGVESWCIDATVPLSEIGTSYDSLGSISDRAAEIIAMGKLNGRSQAEIQAALWNEEGYPSYVNGVYIDPNDSDFKSNGLFGFSVSTWGGAGLQTQAKDPISWPLGGYIQIYKEAADTAFDYVANCPNNYSLKGAVYGVYSDQNCTDLITKLTTGDDGYTDKSKALDPGTYYIKEISASPGFTLDIRMYQVKVVAGKTASITSIETPIFDPFNIILYKLDARQSKYVDHLDEAEFTLKYYDSQSNNPSNPKYTWVFKPEFNSQGKAVVTFDRAHFVRGDDILFDESGDLYLPLGSFTIEETLAPQLYARDENVYVGHVIDAGGYAKHDISSGGALEVDNEDLSQKEDLQSVYLILQKVDEETGKAELPEENITSTATLEGGVFHIYRTGEYSTDKENPQLVDIPPVDYGTLTTDENGRCELKYERVNGVDTDKLLLPGKFRIIEEKAPNGFAINETEFVLEAPVKERNTAVFEYTLEIGDKLTRIQIEKLDQYGDLIDPDAVATIQLIETETGRVVYEFVADGQPHIIKGLTSTINYHLHELYVAPNFRLAIDKDVTPIAENDSEIHYYHMIDHEVEIHTTATFDDTGKKEWDNQSNKHYVADGVAHIYDEVSYKNVYEGETYILIGELWDKTDNVSLDNVVRKEFVPKYDVGIETIEFSQQLDDLDNHELVVFETLYHVVDEEEIEVAEHRDLEDENQTIYVDELYRADFEILKVNADDTEEPLSGVSFHITSHRVKRDGVDEDYDLGEFITDEEGRIFIEKIKEDTVLTITETKEKDYTWYKWEEPFTFDIGHDSSIALHTDQIENHQIKIGTSALFEESESKNYVADGVAHIIDTVNYEWLYEGESYRLAATLIDKGTEEEPLEEEV